MKRSLLILLLCPLLSAAQDYPKFEKDTLYTSSGYKIYAGQTLRFGKAAGYLGFRYITISNGVAPHSLENNSILVTGISDYEASSAYNGQVNITGSIIYRDGSKGTVKLRMSFDLAISNLGKDGTSELIVPDEFRASKASSASSNRATFYGDTLTTSCGYKIFKGQLLQFGKLTGDRYKFRYVNIKNGVPHLTLQYHQVRVNELKDFAFSKLGNGYITIIGTLVVNNSERGDIILHIAFDHAIENLPGVPSEIVVPDEFRNKLKYDPKAEVERLRDLYVNGTLSKGEFEALEKTLKEQ